MLLIPLPTSPQLGSSPTRANLTRRPTAVLSSSVAFNTGGAGHAADARSFYRQGYQVVDNYLVRVLAGQSAWILPPGRVGNAELQVRVHTLGGHPDCSGVKLPQLCSKYLPLCEVGTGPDGYPAFSKSASPGSGSISRQTIGRIVCCLNGFPETCSAFLAFALCFHGVPCLHPPHPR